MVILVRLMATISQKNIMYRVTGIDGHLPTVGLICTPKDLSALNRKHVQMTTSKGVPLVYRYAVTAYGGIIDRSGSGGSSADAILSDSPAVPDTAPANIMSVRFYGTLNNWVYRNGAVKTHAARERMFKDALVTKKMRGAYDRTIHYSWGGGSESYLRPQANVTTPTADMAGGSWEISQLIYPADTGGAYLALKGSHATEETTELFTQLVMPQMYLQSRAEVAPDSNVEVGTEVAKFSVLNKLLSPSFKGTQDEVVALARDEQDNPPYDLTDAGGDWSVPHELGRLQFNAVLGQAASTVIEVPFGITEMRAQILNATEDSTGDIDAEIDVQFRLLGVYEMGG